MRRPPMICATEIFIGLAFSLAHPLGMVLAVAMPALVMRRCSRSEAYRASFCYYAGALWPLIPGARNFFGPGAPPLTAIILWVSACLLLALPWLLIWSPNRMQWWWRAAAGLSLGVIPPLGIIGWASPLTSAGLLFPGMHWCGLVACALAPGLLAAYPRYAAPLIASMAITCNAFYVPVISPADWIAINTRFGGLAHKTVNPMAKYRAALTIQRVTLSTSARVLLFPETVVPIWTAATDAFWQPTVESLRSSGRITIIGARVPIPEVNREPASDPDLRSALELLRDGPISTIPARGPSSQIRYDNAVVIRGAETAIFRQRLPVPLGMWKPFQHGGARMNLFGPGVIEVGERRAAFLVCYEQLLVWPVITSLLQTPDILLGVANDYWVRETPIPGQQRTSMAAWSRLFRLPYLSATNT